MALPDVAPMEKMPLAKSNPVIADLGELISKPMIIAARGQRLVELRRTEQDRRGGGEKIADVAAVAALPGGDAPCRRGHLVGSHWA